MTCNSAALAAEQLAYTPWSPNALYQWDKLANQQKLYIDTWYKYYNLSAKYIGMNYLRTRNSDKTSDGAKTNFLNFNITAAATVYVAHDKRITVKPSWLSNWTDTKTDIIGASTTFDVYSRSFAAGQVKIGGNGGSSNSAMYLVLIEPSSTASSSGSGSSSSSGGTSTGSLTANNDTASTSINRSVAVKVLANDTGLTNTPVKVSIATSSTNGWVTVQSDKSVLYYPKWNFTGTDSFSYQIKDSTGAVATAKGTVSVGTSTSTGSSSGSSSSGSSSDSKKLTISWTHSDADEVDGYNLYSGPSSWDVTDHVKTITSGDMSKPSVTVDLESDLGASEGDTVCFKTRAYNAYGVSLPSQAACITP